MYYNDKKVLIVSRWRWKEATRTGNYDSALWFDRNRDTIHLGKVKFDESKRVTTIPEDSVLYFDKSSEFPRLKLQNTKFKRCIKLDKADYIVVNKSNNVIQESKGYLYSYKSGYIFIYQSDTYDLFGYRNVDLEIKSKFPDAEKVYEGEISLYYTTDNYKVSYNDGIYTKPFIYDSDLNILVDKSFDDVTDEDLNAVIGMLKSPDNDVVNLGLQMLAGFNVSSCPGLITFILHSYPRWKGIYRHGTIVENLLNTLDISRYNVSPYLLLAETINKTKPEEFERVIKVVEPVMKDYIDKMIHDYTCRIKDEKMPKITVNVEWPDCN